VSNLASLGGKYAIYIWPAYAVSVLAFAWMILDTLLRARHWRRRARDLEDDRRRPVPPLHGEGG
jgi:heme exporter protein D